MTSSSLGGRSGFRRTADVGAGEDGLYSVVWTEPTEPQAAIGSYLHKLAYPDNHAAHQAAGSQLKEVHHHHAKDIQDLTLRGEYLYTANGPGGLEVFDVANIDQKGFSERIVTSPVSPLGQRTYVRTKYATSVALSSTLWFPWRPSAAVRGATSSCRRSMGVSRKRREKSSGLFTSSTSERR